MNKYSVESFLHACGADAPLFLEVQRNDGEDRLRRAFHQPFAVIGRAANADLILPDPCVSRRHAYLQVIAGQVYCVCLNTAAWAGDAPEDAARWLYDRQALRLGDHQVRLLRGPASAPPREVNPLAAGSATQLGVPSLTLEFLRGDAVRLRWRMDRLLVLVGSSPECRVRIAGTDGSRFHCSLVSTRQGAWVVDLLGRGGVFLNGMQVRQAQLEEGDVLRIGDVSIRVRYDEPSLPERSPPAPRVAALAEIRPPSAGAGWPVAAALPWGAALGVPPQALPSSLPPEVGQALVLAEGPHNHAVGSLLLPLVSQWNVMQQQMVEQFQQALVQMFQMFSALHKDQVGFLREELERQQQITQELRELQTALGKLQVGQTNGAPRTVPATSEGANGSSAAPAWAAAKPQPEREPAGSRGAPNGAPAAPEQGGAAAGPEVPGEDVHAWLCHRMATLQQERQGGWQRLFSFLVGKRSETPVL
jgi:pSer/pThr/pTyr-binding forkhead associated (FHA) protein